LAYRRYTCPMRSFCATQELLSIPSLETTNSTVTHLFPVLFSLLMVLSGAVSFIHTHTYTNTQTHTETHAHKLIYTHIRIRMHVRKLRDGKVGEGRRDEMGRAIFLFFFFK
jgi:hypothetical protein